MAATPWEGLLADLLESWQEPVEAELETSAEIESDAASPNMEMLAAALNSGWPNRREPEPPRWREPAGEEGPATPDQPPEVPQLASLLSGQPGWGTEEAGPATDLATDFPLVDTHEPALAAEEAAPAEPDEQPGPGIGGLAELAEVLLREYDAPVPEEAVDAVAAETEAAVAAEAEAVVAAEAVDAVAAETEAAVVAEAADEVVAEAEAVVAAEAVDAVAAETEAAAVAETVDAVVAEAEAVVAAEAVDAVAAEAEAVVAGEAETVAPVPAEQAEKTPLTLADEAIRSAAEQMRPRDRYVAFECAGNLYALPLERVAEVERVPHLTVVPGAPPVMCGLVNRRGDIVPLIDLRLLLAGTPADDPQGGRLVMAAAEAGTEPVAFLVDRLAGLASIEKTEMAPAGPGAGETATPYLAGRAKHRGRELLVLDAGALREETERCFAM